MQLIAEGDDDEEGTIDVLYDPPRMKIFFIEIRII